MGDTSATRANVGAADENKVNPALRGKRKREALGEVITKNINKNKVSTTNAKDGKVKRRKLPH